MPQKAFGGSAKSSVMQRKNVPAKRKKGGQVFDKKSTKALNKTLETKAAAKALKNESKFNFSLKELNEKGKDRLDIDEKAKQKKAAKKRSSADRQEQVVEKAAKRSKNDLE